MIYLTITKARKMNWELYEVWAVDSDGETLIETTKSLKEARLLAELNVDLEQGIRECVVYQENEDGTLTEVLRVK